MIASLPLRKTLAQIIFGAGALMLLSACGEEDSMAGGFKDDRPSGSAPQLVYDVTDIDIAVMESFPLQIRITAQGHTRTGGWSDAQLVLDQEASQGIHLVYRFVAVRPTGMATQMITPISASVTYGPWADRAAREIEIIAQTNSEVLMFPGPGQE